MHEELNASLWNGNDSTSLSLDREWQSGCAGRQLGCVQVVRLETCFVTGSNS